MTSSCCVSGSIHSGTPTGRTDKVHSLDCYIAEPPSGTPKGVVVILPDPFGWKFVNNRVLADNYAKNGELMVYLPELMQGTSYPSRYLASFALLNEKGFVATVRKIYHFACLMPRIINFKWHCRRAVMEPKLFGFMHALRRNEAAELPLAAAGFCWGGYWTVRLCWDVERAENWKPLVDCGYTAHPSGLTVPDDIQKVKLPLSVAVASQDIVLSHSRTEAIRDELVGKTKKGEEEHEYVLYEGAHHGFAVRGSDMDPKESKQASEAEEQALNWFAKWFGT